MNTFKELVLACLVAWAMVQAMGFSGMILSKEVAYQSIIK